MDRLKALALPLAIIIAGLAVAGCQRAADSTPRQAEQSGRWVVHRVSGADPRGSILIDSTTGRTWILAAAARGQDIESGASINGAAMAWAPIGRIEP